VDRKTLTVEYAPTKRMASLRNSAKMVSIFRLERHANARGPSSDLSLIAHNPSQTDERADFKRTAGDPIGIGIGASSGPGSTMGAIQGRAIRLFQHQRRVACDRLPRCTRWICCDEGVHSAGSQLRNWWVDTIRLCSTDVSVGITTGDPTLQLPADTDADWNLQNRSFPEIFTDNPISAAS